MCSVVLPVVDMLRAIVSHITTHNRAIYQSGLLLLPTAATVLCLLCSGVLSQTRSEEEENDYMYKMEKKVESTKQKNKKCWTLFRKNVLLILRRRQ